MQTKFKNLKNELEDLEQGQPIIDEHSEVNSFKGNSKLANYILLIAFITTLIFYAGSKINFSDFNPIDNIVTELTQPNEQLLIEMGEWMEEMGYGVLSREELIALRSEGVTATYTSQIREMGYTDVTLEQLVALQQADVSVEFTRMMKELGYDLSIDDLVRLRDNNVTAYFTSNMMDMGYTLDELTMENLIRMRSLGISHNLVQQLMEERGAKPTIDEIIRYYISNQ